MAMAMVGATAPLNMSIRVIESSPRAFHILAGRDDDDDDEVEGEGFAGLAGGTS